MGYSPWGHKESDTTELLAHKGLISINKEPIEFKSKTEQIHPPKKNIKKWAEDLNTNFFPKKTQGWPTGSVERC